VPPRVRSDDRRTTADVSVKGYIEWVAHSITDIAALSLYYMVVFGVALVTEPWLHLRFVIASDGLDDLARTSEIIWGAVFLVIAAGYLWRPRPFGLTAAFLLAGIRAYDFYSAPHGPNFVFFVGQLIFAALAVRGTVRRTEAYALAQPRKTADRKG
jgi:hypothetical protein